MTLRRNEPCHCGSGIKFKHCHGRLEDGPPVAVPAAPDRLTLAMQAHQAGQLEVAERRYLDILAEAPDDPVATHYVGVLAWQRGELERAATLMRTSLEVQPANPDFNNNLGLVLHDAGDTDAAIRHYRRAIELRSDYAEAHNNLGLALQAQADGPAAIVAYRTALIHAPQFARARRNLALALLAKGQSRAAWPEYAWRFAAQGIASEAPDAVARLRPRMTPGARITLREEQGLGDILFFLRYAEAARRRGWTLAFRGDVRLHALLQRTGLFGGGISPPSAAASDECAIAVGDLPWLLDLGDDEQYPPPLALAPIAGRVDLWRRNLAGLGPPPYLAVSWRAGTVAVGEMKKLAKVIDPYLLGSALSGFAGTVVSVQRNPNAREAAQLDAGLQRTVHDLSAANADLDDMLALLAVVDEYVGVSNTNTHLRAGLGREARVLLPSPPEWRWLHAGHASPWFPRMQLYRQTAAGSWMDALQALRADLGLAG